MVKPEDAYVIDYNNFAIVPFANDKKEAHA